MPHIHVSDFETPKFPQTIDGYTFHAMYKNSFDHVEYLVETSVDDKEFFLLFKQTKEGYLIKAEKATRPSPTFYLHDALKHFAAICKAPIVASTIPELIKKTHLEEQQSALKTIDFFVHSFPKERPISIEVGFGSGRHLLYQAKNDPDTLFIGLEIHKPSIEQVVKQIAIQNLKNLLVLDYDARLFLELVPSNSVKNIYVHFPVPWDKKPMRRVISRSFIDESVRVLMPTGTLELRTDSENYFSYSLETFLQARQLDFTIKKNLDAPITSKYEDRWRKMEKNIYDVIMLGRETSPELIPFEAFTFKAPVSAETIESLTQKTLLSGLGFIHFERHFHNGDDVMIRISMGSFERPEQLYLKCTPQGISYFPTTPTPSKTNALEHHILEELLYG